MLLAEVAGPGANEMWTGLAGIAVVASILGNIAQWQISRRKRENILIQNQPLDVRMISELVKREECQSRHSESMNGIDKIERDLMELRNARVEDARAAAISRKGIYEDLKSMRREAAQDLDAVRKELSGLIAEMPSQLVTILKNTGAIK